MGACSEVAKVSPRFRLLSYLRKQVSIPRRCAGFPIKWGMTAGGGNGREEGDMTSHIVIPAQAGIHLPLPLAVIPAQAGIQRGPEPGFPIKLGMTRGTGMTGSVVSYLLSQVSRFTGARSLPVTHPHGVVARRAKRISARRDGHF